MITVVAWVKLLKVEAIAVFNGVTSVVVVRFAFIDINTHTLIILFISVITFTREAACSVGTFSLVAIVRLAFVYVYACFAISCETFQARTLITPMCVDTLAAYIRTVVNEVAFVDVCGY